MPSRNSHRIRKPAIKKKKSSWENNKDTIVRLYKEKTLEEVVQIMADSYGFHAK